MSAENEKVEQVEPVKRDMRRPDLAVKYVQLPTFKNDVSSTMSTSMPIAAMFMRNKILSWASFFTTIQAFLNEPLKPTKDAQPAWLSVVLAVVGLFTCYMDIIMPPRGPTMQNAARASLAAANAAASASSSGASLTETVVEAVSTAVESVVSSK